MNKREVFIVGGARTPMAEYVGVLKDRQALRSQQQAARAWDDGRLAEEVVPVAIKTRKGTTVFSRDEPVGESSGVGARDLYWPWWRNAWLSRRSECWAAG